MADKIKPILRLMWKVEKFSWDENCDTAFIAVKKGLATLLVLNKLIIEEPLLVYLVISDEAISVAIALGKE